MKTADIRQGPNTFEKTALPLLRVFENISASVWPNCGHSEHIFGPEGGKTAAPNATSSTSAHCR